MRSTRRYQKGQTLILGVLALLVLVLAIFFLFDLQHVVRTKLKSQTAVDAAALASANWQTHTLNVIGELNLIKACSALATDIDPAFEPITFDQFAAMSSEERQEYIENQREQLTEAADALTELQTRMSFVGPLLGFAAAQQAAKNNGMDNNDGYSTVVQNHLSRILDDSVYGNPPLSQEIQGYEWRTPYSDMLWNILEGQGGIAVAPNTRFLGAPRLEGREPYISYMQDHRVYEAINANYWCYIRDLIRTLQNDSLSSGKWWGDIQIMLDSTSFPEESEYVPVDIDFFTGETPFQTALSSGAFTSVLADREDLATLDGEDFYLTDENGDILEDSDGNPIRNPNDTDNLINILPYISWAVYGDTWEDNAPAEQWTESMYLRSSLRPEFIYGGAVSKYASEVETETLSGFWGTSREVSEDDKTLGDAVSFSNKKVGDASFDEFGSRLSDAETQVRQGLGPTEASALAKPLGQISVEGDSELSPPNAAVMTLPVFDKASLIPVAMGDPGGLDPFDYRWYAFLTEYLPALGTVNDISSMSADILPDPSHWSWFTSYHNALVKLNDPEWRQQGIDWLDAEATGEDVLDESGNVISHVTLTTNEDHCDDWPTGSGGNREGPDILH